MRLENLKFLPSSLERLSGKVATSSIAEVLETLPNPTDSFGFKKFRVDTLDADEAVVRLAAVSRYFVVPNVQVTSTQGSPVSANLSFDKKAKRILGVWLGILVIVFAMGPIGVFAEFVWDDGMMNLTVNGEVSKIPVLPWFPLFTLGWLAIAFGFPAMLISLGWRKSREFAIELMGLMDGAKPGRD